MYSDSVTVGGVLRIVSSMVKVAVGHGSTSSTVKSRSTFVCDASMLELKPTLSLKVYTPSLLTFVVEKLSVDVGLEVVVSRVNTDESKATSEPVVMSTTC